MSFRRILVPTDFSDASDGALAQAREVAAAFGASVVLVHVFDDPVVTGALAGDDQMILPADLQDTIRRDATSRLEERLEQVVSTGLGHRTELLVGPVAASIVSYAESHAIDLIVMGTHGRGGMAHLLLGSVAERVVRTAPCPVLTTRRQPAVARVVPAPGPACALVPAQA